ncbi:uncharacterized protein B0I36DRAFT_331472 [Microdochium trichocladiopsis]|uniref:Uncharacterized protein n=1 Tax=Microdochium trichocladiopsis TaxID=1682393 RepID=A0A9P8XX59_9PEZI|nr:uncharacterized protein B0I36DRAFT_331472 [Microdochium trichocladiopsis]KAH7024468.1 hypothetical protein B0I36DRAFT_331472 [Microdochium trichocladiopsis]
MTTGWEDALLKHLDMRSLKFEYASLYAQLVTEWLSSEKTGASKHPTQTSGATTQDNDDVDDVGMADAGNDEEDDDDFEDLALAAKKEARAEFEQQVFTAADLDEQALQDYLADIFGVADATDPAYSGHQEALKALRENIKFSETLLASPNQFNERVLRWVCEGLIVSGSLSDEKRQVLQDFKNQPVILGEVADVLNMRIQSLDTWSWGPHGVGVDQERQINGVYNAVMREDLLQALLLYYIGSKISTFLKQHLRSFRKAKEGAWASPHRKMDPRDRARRQYYLRGRGSARNSIQGLRDKVYRKHYFLSALKKTVSETSQHVAGEMEAQYSGTPYATFSASSPPPPPGAMPRAAAPMMSMARAAPAVAHKKMRKRIAHHDPSDENTDSETDSAPDTDHEEDVEQDGGATSPQQRNTKNLSVVKQRLLRLLSTEAIINTKLYGEMTAVHGMFDDWNVRLPHQTILGVLAFMGFSPKWLGFFERFLAAPLRFGEDGPDAPLRPRRRGTPASRVLSDVFGEATLFCLDLGVNKATDGAHLWRLQDEFWFWSRDLAASEKAWNAVKRFEKVTSTSLNMQKSGSVRIDLKDSKPPAPTSSLPRGDIRWGFLRLSPSTGAFEIDQNMVDKQILDLRKQLYSKRASIVAFLSSWNTYASTFFTHNFGKPANCFGRKHVEAMLAAHRRVQTQVFAAQTGAGMVSLTTTTGRQQDAESPTSMVGFLKDELTRRFGVADIPDAFLFFPTDMGGLDLRSPFVEILQVHKTVLADPRALLDRFLDEERRAHRTLEKAWEESGPPASQHGESSVGLGMTRGEDRQVYAKRSRSIAGSGAEGGDQAETALADEFTFLPYDEFVKYREDRTPSTSTTNRTGFMGLGQVYRELLRLPAEDGVHNVSPAVAAAIESLGGNASPAYGAVSRGDGGGSSGDEGITGSLSTMKPYWRWIVAMYGPEVVAKVGGLRIVEPGLLPMGMVRMFKERRVQWEA